MTFFLPSQFGSDSFNVVVDKGGLDALMGEPGQEGEAAGNKMLYEVLKSSINKLPSLRICLTSSSSSDRFMIYLQAPFYVSQFSSPLTQLSSN